MTPEDQVSKSQLVALLQRLNEANLRIAELEQEARANHAKLDDLERRVVSRLRIAHSMAGPQTVFPAFGLGHLLRAAPVAERRKVWSECMEQLGVATALADVYPHDRGGDPLSILVRGSGGYGDMLYLAMFVRGLHVTFPDARIHVIHEHPGLASIFNGNPYVASATSIAGSQGVDFLQLATLLDCFDLVADVRYAITYCAPPLSRIDPVWLAEANQRAVPWQSYVRQQWPYLNNIFAKQIVAGGHTKYSFVKHTGHLHKAEGNWGDFFGIESWSDFSKQPYIDQLQRPYVTVHHGSDRFMADANGMQTKNLPLATWEDIVSRLDRMGVATVQLGEAHETPIPGVSVDLRGQSQFAQTAQLIRFAQCHIDTEGGLVHLARAVGTTAVVAFGPTAVKFFGYPENVNLAAGECGDCWWTAADWATRCPRNLPDVPCMASHKAADLVKAAQPLLDARTDIALSARSLPGDAPTADFLADLVRGQATPALVVADDAQMIDQLARRFPGSDALWFLALGQVTPGKPRRVADNPVGPAVWDRLPCENAQFAEACIVLGQADPKALASLTFELARVMKVNGSARIIIARPGKGLDASAIAKALSQLPGQRLGHIAITESTPVAGGEAFDLNVEFRKGSAPKGGAGNRGGTTKPSLGTRVRALVNR